MEFLPHSYQSYAIGHVMEHPFCGLFLEMGLGKTVITLTAVDRLLYEEFEVDRVLVIAPKRVAESTWKTEAGKWDHLKHLKISTVLGTEAQRNAALSMKADIYVINRENVVWLVNHCRNEFPFDMVVIDELSSFKSAKAARFKALRRIRPYLSRVIGLTGTPAPNGLIDLWPQLYLLDLGERLGKTVTGFRHHYFTPGRSNGYVVYDYLLKEGSDKNIREKISDICISMKTEDYLTLPKRIDRCVPVHLPEAVRKKYREFEKKQILSLEENKITAINAAVLSGKLLQFANGAVYDESHTAHEVHRCKLEALEELVEAANGQPVLIFYSFRHDLARISSILADFSPRELSSPEDIKLWNEGRISVLLCHPAGAGHGLNLQAGGNIIIWFGLTWSLELYQQANARLYRQGQEKPVIVHHLITEGTIEEDVLKAVTEKSVTQEALLQALKARIKQYRTTT